MRTARTLEAEGGQALQGSVGTGAKEDESSTEHFWASGFHHVTTRSPLVGVWNLWTVRFFNFQIFRATINPRYWIGWCGGRPALANLMLLAVLLNILVRVATKSKISPRITWEHKTQDYFLLPFANISVTWTCNLQQIYSQIQANKEPIYSAYFSHFNHWEVSDTGGLPRLPFPILFFFSVPWLQ
jgi:hypothetical protein